ncbi:MAG: hypothetical protein KBF36_04620 [Chitinophagaceae bacterium]|jgi:hypothetical protein|nr:hypothetical protein [Chitinophagaceae bacterium]
MEMYFKFIDAQSLLKKAKAKKFPFSQYLFWDAAIEKIDVQKNKRYIIERVLTRGFLEDFYTLLQIYSTEEIVETLKKSKELDSKTIHFCSYYFNIPKSEMHVSSFYR